MTQHPKAKHASVATIQSAQLERLEEGREDACADLCADSRATLRKQLLQSRRALSAEVRLHWDQQLAEKFLAWCRQHRPAVLGVYWPIRGEPDLRDSYAALHQMGVALALPVASVKGQALRFAQWQAGDVMAQDGYGIAVPTSDALRVQPQALLIPCVGFNAQGFRMGYGGGFYDRTLAKLPRPYALGVAYETGRAEFDAAPHDVAMDELLIAT